MRLLLLTDWTYPCDHQFLSKVYANHFIERGNEVTWVMRPEDDSQQSIDRDVWNGSDVYILPSSAYNPARDATRFFTGRIQSNPLFDTDIDFTNFDLIHVRNDLSMGLIASHLTKQYTVPYVHQISHLKAEALIEAARQGHDTQFSWVKGHLGKRLRQRVADSADLVLPISDAMQQYLKQGGYTTPMVTLPTGAEVANEVPDDEQFKDKYDISSEFTLLYMGSMSPYRNLEFLFDVLDEVCNTHDAHLVMAGGRAESDRTRLQKKAVEKGVSSKVTFTGWISDREEIQSAVAAADVGLSPFPTDSILRTNAPIKTLEYMSLRTPVVASATPDQESVLTESNGGLAVDYSTNAFVDAINQLLSSRTVRERMGNQGQEYLAENRNFDVLADRVEQVYGSLVAE